MHGGGWIADIQYFDGLHRGGSGTLASVKKDCVGNRGNDRSTGGDKHGYRNVGIAGCGCNMNDVVVAACLETAGVHLDVQCYGRIENRLAGTGGDPGNPGTSSRNGSGELEYAGARVSYLQVLHQDFRNGRTRDEAQHGGRHGERLSRVVVHV